MFPWNFISNTMKLIVKWINIFDVSIGKGIKLSVQQVCSGKRRTISSARDSSKSNKVVYDRSDWYYTADTTDTGSNCYILQYTVKWCDLSPYCDDCESNKGIPIVHT